MKTPQQYIDAAIISLDLYNADAREVSLAWRRVATRALELCIADTEPRLIKSVSLDPVTDEASIQYADERLNEIGFPSPFLYGVEYQFAVTRRAIASGRARVHRLLAQHAPAETLLGYIAGARFVLTGPAREASTFVGQALEDFAGVVLAELGLPAGEYVLKIPAAETSYFLSTPGKIAQAEREPEYRGPASLDPRWQS